MHLSFEIESQDFHDFFFGANDRTMDEFYYYCANLGFPRRRPKGPRLRRRRRPSARPRCRPELGWRGQERPEGERRRGRPRDRRTSSTWGRSQAEARDFHVWGGWVEMGLSQVRGPSRAELGPNKKMTVKVPNCKIELENLKTCTNKQMEKVPRRKSKQTFI